MISGLHSDWSVSARFVFFLPQRESEKKKKEEGQRTRADKQLVLDMLFGAFERHQYYNIKDLVELTKQPVVRPRGTVGPNPENKTEHLIIVLVSYLPSFTWRRSWEKLACTTSKDLTSIPGSSGQNTDITVERNTPRAAFWSILQLF